ncbi:GAF domain-containing sensor histidine kinase [Geomonas propionica]|uniref:histidine kinase n=1 Tax=Geomonas propionica TaxID=2798582 RepID=A0ABS0YLD8_9BACT|nr:ATP-binding protein [Geomonas propionica]MBJ6798783.1 GAF domain-containing protein [Geomonas propionica]
MKNSDFSNISTHVGDPTRLAALRAVALLDTPAEEAFDRLTRLASQFADAPVSLVSLIDSDRQFFKSCRGLPEPWQSRRETPLSHSFCQYNRVANQPLIIEDARVHPFFKDNPAIKDLNVIAYLGIPLATVDGYILGSFCVIDSRARKWTSAQVSVIEDLAASVMTEIQLRTEIRTRISAEKRMQEKHEELCLAHRDLQRESAERLRTAEQLRQMDQMLIQQGRLAAMGEMISNIAHQWRQPLNVLALLAQDLPMTYRLGELDERYLDDKVRRMMEAIAHMSRTIDTFRNFFSPGKDKVRFRVLDAVEKTVSLVDTSLQELNIKIEVFSSADPMIDGYPSEYAQVLLNILINARDVFLARKVEHPSIRIEVGEEDGRSLVMLRDNGGGIPEEISDRIFDPYFSTKGPQGTGIGLYMSKMIIERNMGGSLTAGNADGGAMFRVKV